LSEGFNVVGLGEEIEHFQGIEPVALLEQEPEVAGQRRRATGNVVKAFGPQRHEQFERRDAGARMEFNPRMPKAGLAARLASGALKGVREFGCDE
jgi:hypothetical protein